MDPVLRHADAAQQRRAGLLLVALVVVGGHEALVAPPDVDLLPVDRLAHRLRGQAGHVLQHGDADPAAGQHDRGRAVHRLGGGQPGDQRLGGRAGQVLGVRLDDDVRGGSAHELFAAARFFGGEPLSSAGSNHTCSRFGERSARSLTPVADSSASL